MSKFKNKQICRKCGNTLIRGMRYCTACGEKVVYKKCCEICGTRVRKKDLFCPNCGEMTELAREVYDRITELKALEHWSEDLDEFDDSWADELDELEKIDGVEDTEDIDGLGDLDELEDDSDLSDGGKIGSGGEVDPAEDDYYDPENDNFWNEDPGPDLWAGESICGGCSSGFDSKDSAGKDIGRGRDKLASYDDVYCPFSDYDETDCELCENSDYLGCEKERPLSDEDESEKYADLDLTVINDSGFYRHGSVSNKITLNTDKYLYYAKLFDTRLNMIDKNMQGHYVDIDKNSEVKGYKSIEGMTILNGLLVVFVSTYEGKKMRYGLEYYSPKLKFLKSEIVPELDFVCKNYPAQKFLKSYKVDSDSIMIYIKSLENPHFNNTDISAKVVYFNFEDWSIYEMDITGTSINGQDLGVKGRISSVDRIYKHLKDTYFVLTVYEDINNNDYRLNKIVVKYEKETEYLEVIWDKNRNGELPLFYDFGKNVMWTFVSKSECKKLDLGCKRTSKYLCWREISSDHRILEPHMFRKVNNPDIPDLLYFDGYFMCSTPIFYEFNVITKMGNRISWPNDGRGRTFETLVWQDKVIGDLHSKGSCYCWDKRVKYLEGQKIEGVAEF